VVEAPASEAAEVVLVLVLVQLITLLAATVTTWRLLAGGGGNGKVRAIDSGGKRPDIYGDYYRGFCGDFRRRLAEATVCRADVRWRRWSRWFRSCLVRQKAKAAEEAVSQRG